MDDGVHRADARTRGSGRQRHDGGRDRRPQGVVQGAVPPPDDDRRHPREDRLRHHGPDGGAAARSVQASRRRDRRNDGQGQAHRRHLRPLLRRGAHPAHVRLRLPDRDVAAVQAPPRQRRSDGALRALRQRQGAQQRLLGAQRPDRPAGAFPRTAAPLGEGRRRGDVHRHGLRARARIRHAHLLGHGYRHRPSDDVPYGRDLDSGRALLPADASREEGRGRRCGVLYGHRSTRGVGSRAAEDGLHHGRLAQKARPREVLQRTLRLQQEKQARPEGPLDGGRSSAGARPNDPHTHDKKEER